MAGCRTALHAAPLLVVLAALVALPAVDAFRALGVFPFNGRSHNILFKASNAVPGDARRNICTT